MDKESVSQHERQDQVFLEPHELIGARMMLYKHTQLICFPDAIRALQENRYVPDGHSLSALSPFLDEQGVLRVGGRLQKAALSADQTHPIILSAQSHLVTLMIRQTHQRLQHAGPSTVMATLAMTFHIPRIKAVLKKISRKCITCQKAYARTSRQLMGELPADRVRPSPPFTTVGIDFAGPFYHKEGQVRRPVMVKCYLCLYVCFSTKAVHLELTRDMTTASFIGAMVRFTSRRGLPATVYMDNGSNFVGGEAELRRTLATLQEIDSMQTVTKWAAERQIDWRFSPAKAPHFGGLWEAAVKAAKIILKKVLADHRLTYEELTTVIANVEGTLNSRPLAPLDSPSDDAIVPLTPGHFLIGRPIASWPVIPTSIVS